MDMTIIVSPMEAGISMVSATIMGLKGFITKVFTLIERTVVLARPSIAGTSLSAVSPDYILIGGTA